MPVVSGWVTNPSSPEMVFFPIGRRAGVMSLNSLSGHLNIVGGQGVEASVSGNNVVINTISGGQLQLSGYITTGQADLRYYPLGSNPSGYITGFNSGLYITRAETGEFASSGDLYQTGQDLIALINSISAGVSQVNGLSGTIDVIGLGTVTITESGNSIVVSGGGDVGTGDYISRYTQQRFKALANTGFDQYYVNYPSDFTVNPIVNVTLETSSIYSYMLSISNISETGFLASFSDDILETGVYLNILAQID